MAETRSDRGGLIVGGIIMLLLGAGLLFVCYSVIHETGQCAGETMRAGDSCQHTKRSGAGYTNDADEEKAANHSTAWWTGGMGGVLLLGGGAAVFSALSPRTVSVPAAAQSSTRTSVHPPQPTPSARYVDHTEALSALARGEVLTFGELSLDTSQLKTSKGVLAWPQIKQVKLDGSGRYIAIFRHGKVLPIMIPLVTVPNSALVVTLAEQLRLGL